MKKLLAIGGPKSFEWLPDNGQNYVVAVPRPVSFNDFNGNPTLATMEEITTHIYSKYTIGSYQAERVKNIYVSQDVYSPKEAEELLKQWLMDQFLNMDDPDDGS